MMPDHTLIVRQLPTNNCSDRLCLPYAERKAWVPHILAPSITFHTQEPDLFEKLVTNPGAVHRDPAASTASISRSISTYKMAQSNAYPEDCPDDTIGKKSQPGRAPPGLAAFSPERSNMSGVSYLKNGAASTKRTQTADEAVADGRHYRLRKRNAPSCSPSIERATKIANIKTNKKTDKKWCNRSNDIVRKSRKTSHGPIETLGPKDKTSNHTSGQNTREKTLNPENSRALSTPSNATEMLDQSVMRCKTSHSSLGSLPVTTTPVQCTLDRIGDDKMKELQNLRQQLESANETIRMLIQKTEECNVAAAQKMVRQGCYHVAEECENLREKQKSIARIEASQQGLVDENARLRRSLETVSVKAPRSQNIQAYSSPALSSQGSTSTSGERKEDNIRKVYIKTKRQYDVLHAVVKKLAMCTRSMDLSSFGEFGTHLKELKNLSAEEDIGYEQSTHTMDDDALESRA